MKKNVYPRQQNSEWLDNGVRVDVVNVRKLDGYFSRSNATIVTRIRYLISCAYDVLAVCDKSVERVSNNAMMSRHEFSIRKIRSSVRRNCSPCWSVLFSGNKVPTPKACNITYFIWKVQCPYYITLSYYRIIYTRTQT